jgi:hypothetical protein
MKYIYTLIFLFFFPLKSEAEMKKIHYFCKMNTKFFEIDKNGWSQKNINYDFYVENNTHIRIFDKQIKNYINTLDILINTEEALVGYYLNDKMINTFTFNKITRSAKYSNMYFHELGGGQIGVGQCYPKFV